MVSLESDKSKKSGYRTFIMILQNVVAVSLFLPIPAQALETVTLQLKWLHQFQFAGYYAAKAKGYYRDAGIDVNFTEAKPGQRSIVPVLEGTAQYGVDGSNLLLTRGEGKPVVALSAIFQHSPVVLIARQYNPSQSIHSLTGKRMMLDENNDEILAYLRKEHLSADKYSLVKHSFNPQDLIDGKIDAIAAYTTNELFYLEKAGFRYLAFSPRSAGIDFYGDVLYTTEQEIKTHPARVKAFREASNQGWKYALAHPEEIADLILAQYSQRKSREYLLFEAKQMKELIHPELVEIGYMNPGRWLNIAETYADLGMLPRDVSLTGFMYDPAPKNNNTRLVLVVMILSVCLAITAGFLILLKSMVKHKTAHLETESAERRRAEKALMESESRFRSLMEDIPSVATQGYSLDGTVLFWNRASELLYGYSSEEAMGSNLLDLIIPEEMKSGVTEAIQQMIKSGEPIPAGELLLKRKDGSRVPVFSSHALINPIGRQPELFCLDIDLSERKAAEELLIQLKESVENSTDAIGMATPEGKHVYENKAFTNMFGTFGDNPPDLYVDENIGKEQFRAVMTGGQWSGEVKMYGKDNRVLDILLRAYANKDASGRIIGLVGIHTDITERKRSEEERSHLEKQLLHAQKLESLGVLAGGIAHDFNNILMAIIGNADLALMRINKESPATENLHRIEQAAARAADLAKQMLAYSGKGKFVIDTIDLNNLIEDMLHMLEVSISKKAVLRLNPHHPLPQIEADATQIRQIVMNLVINASEAIGDKSGVIAITTGCMDCDKNYLKDVWLEENLTEGLYVYLEIADTGCGMGKETLAKIFDPFFTTKFTGRGLGMAAVLGIVRGHKGAIKVYSEPKKGTTFKLLFPASSKQEKFSTTLIIPTTGEVTALCC